MGKYICTWMWFLSIFFRNKAIRLTITPNIYEITFIKLSLIFTYAVRKINQYFDNNVVSCIITIILQEFTPLHAKYIPFQLYRFYRKGLFQITIFYKVLCNKLSYYFLRTFMIELVFVKLPQNPVVKD